LSKKQTPLDPFSENIIANIPLDVRSSFNQEQLQAIREALATAHDRSRHIIDIRFSIPLYFVKYYIVFLYGKDLRRDTRRILLERRKESSLAAGFTVMFVLFINLLLIMLVIMFLAIYFLKSALGIDIFPDSHLMDIFSLVIR